MDLNKLRKDLNKLNKTMREYRNNKYFEIRDWAGNLMYDGERFADFDSAEEYLCERLGSEYEEYRGDIYITLVERK